MTDNRYPQIDFHELRLMVNQKAELLLQNINEEDLSYFLEQVKKGAAGILTSFSYATFDLYTSGPRRITDSSKLESFSDFQSGYENQIEEWISNNPITLRGFELFTPPTTDGSTPLYGSNSERFKPWQSIPISGDSKCISPSNIFIGGTVIAIGLLLFSKPWAALVTEAATMALCHHQKSKIEASKQELESAKNRLINEVLEDLTNWLKRGNSKSDEILESFNL